MRIIVTTQAEFDALPQKFDEWTTIEIRGRVSVRGTRENSSVEAWENSSVEAWENSSVEAWENSSVVAWENSSVVAWENSSVVARGNSSVVAWGNSSVEARENSSVVAWENSSVVARENSSVEARENSSVVARENSSVVAWGNSSVVAWENSSVEARENSSVVARENSSVVAWGNSSVVARGNSSVVAWENSSVVARGNSSVEAWGNSSVEAWENSSVVARENSFIRAFSSLAKIALFGSTMCMKHCAIELDIKSDRVVVSEESPRMRSVEEWLSEHGIVAEEESCFVFKRVSKEWQTQEQTKNETIWKPGTSLVHHDWRPESGECGPGKFHACATAFFCDEFRANTGDRYVKLKVKLSDLHFFTDYYYPHKIAFRACEVVCEVDREGKEITA